MSGKIWPGITRSSGRAFLATAVRTVRARSAAEIPVVIPSAASMETVKLVSCWDEFRSTMRGKLSCLARRSVIVKQIRPQASRAKNVMCWGVTTSAAMIKSPSFSRSSSSSISTIFPRRKSSSISSMVLNCIGASKPRSIAHSKVLAARRGRLRIVGRPAPRSRAYPRIPS